MQHLLFKCEPFQDELLSSWLTRNAYLNYMSLQSFLGAIFPAKIYYKKDMELYKFNDEFYNTLEYVTEVDSRIIRNLQLYKYEGYIEETIHINGRHHWFTPSHSSNFSNSFYGIRFCPKCLKEKGYFKDIWRVMFINSCKEHLCYLHNSCPKCNRPIDTSKNSYKLQYTQCWHCGFDLTQTKIKSINISSHEYYAQELLHQIAQQGYYIFQNRQYYSLGLFFLFRTLVRNILKVHPKLKNDYIEQLKPSVLSPLISDALKLLENYPHNLTYFCKENKLTNEHAFYDKYRFQKDKLPNWFLFK